MMKGHDREGLSNHRGDRPGRNPRLGWIFIFLAFLFFISSQVWAGLPVRVAVSIPPQAAFVRQIGEYRVSIQILLPPGANPATYEPKARELVTLSNAAIYFQIHVPFEDAWMEKFRSVNKKMAVVDTTEGIVQEGKDPHVWLAPTLVEKQAREIARGLSMVDPAGRPVYKRNLRKFDQAIDRLIREIQRRLSPLKRRTLLVYHPCWGYFAKEFGLKQVAIKREGKTPGAALLAKIIARARREGISCVFAQPQFDTRSARIIARQIHGRLVLIDPLAENWEENLLRVTDKIAGCLGK